MSAAEYLLDAIRTGQLRDGHIATLIRHWQYEHGLIADGLCGPRTIASIVDEHEARRTSADLHLRALAHALNERGHGEDPQLGNNRGAAVYRYRQNDGTGLPWDVAAPWCAAFTSYTWNRAAEDAGVELPFATSRSAKQLAENIAEAGRECAHPEVGAVICWHRSKLGAASRKGHCAQIASYDLDTDTLVTVDGNKTERGRRFATVEEFHHPNGRWRRRLYLIATIAPRSTTADPERITLPLPLPPPLLP